jgi:hypothetical protein
MMLSRAIGASIRSLLLLAFCVVLGACTEPLPPQDIADRFWRAVVAQQPATIARYVVARDRAQIDQDSSILPISAYELGRIVIEGTRASVATQVTLDGDTPLTLGIETRLVKEEAGWRVDYQETVAALSAQGDLARVIEKLGAIGETVRRGVEQSAEEMKRALPTIERELSRLEAEISQRVPELRDRLDAFAKSLEEALKRPPPAADGPAPTPESTPEPNATIAL